MPPAGRILTPIREQLPFLPRALRLVWTAARWRTVVWLVLLLVQGILPVALVFLTRVLVDRLTAVAGTGGSWVEIRETLAPALLMALLLLVGEVLRAATRWVRTVQAELVRDHVSSLIHARAIAADLAYFESPAYHDQLYRARIDSHERPVALVENLGTLLQNSLTLVAMAAVLIPFGWWVPLALVASTIPALAVVARHAIRQHRWMIDSTPQNRRTWYYDWLLCTRETAPELRLFNLGEYFSDAFQLIRGKLRQQRSDLARSEAATATAAGVFALTVMGGVLVSMVIRAVQGTITLGGLAMFFQAFTHGQRLMRSLLETVGQIYANTLFLENLFAFLAVEPEVVDPRTPVSPPPHRPPTIRFHNVSFTYPASERTALEDFNLEVPAGTITAILGVNGAGKSTLFKLLCRLYDPLQGRIEIGGIDLCDLEVADVRRLVTVLFQEPVHFSETVRNNITLAGAEREAAEIDVTRALEGAGAQEIVDRLPRGIETLLGTWFAGGAELSVGEWQRIALARAIHRDAPVLLLDEPTAAMDSWAEAEWVGHLKRMTEDRTVILITHRLTTAMAADRIHIIDQGRIIESGSHRELIAAQGRYAKAWRAQVGNAAR
ncbi:MAG: ABC transporter ATP-binding protein [Thermoanaerobaculales bacterium]